MPKTDKSAKVLVCCKVGGEMAATIHCDDSEGQVGGGMAGRFLVKVWRGHESLGTVFWIYGVLGAAALSALFLVTQARGNPVGQQGLILLLAIHSWWIVGSIWRSAARDDNYFHGCARAATLAWGINAVLLLGFLEVDLIGQFLR